MIYLELKRIAAPTGATLDDCVHSFLERHVVKLRSNTQKLYNYPLNKHAIGVFDFPVEDVTIREWYNYFYSFNFHQYTPSKKLDLFNNCCGQLSHF